VTNFRFALVHEDGEPANPPAFNTVIPTWREGDEFLAGENLQRFRIAGISPVTGARDPAAGVFDAFWLVDDTLTGSQLSSAPAGRNLRPAAG
jgi:hypothetical protein